MSDALDHIEALANEPCDACHQAIGEPVALCPAHQAMLDVLTPLLVNVARAAEFQVEADAHAWMGSELKAALAAVERWADEHLPEAGAA